MKLTASYFTGELRVPSIGGNSYSEVENLTALNLAIKKHEPAFLKRLLGEDMYTAYAAAMNASPTSGRWYDLNCQIYSEDTTSPALYESPAANYVYFKFWQRNISTTSVTGESQAKVENAESVAISNKLAWAWNEMADKAAEIQSWLDDNAATYPEWDSTAAESFTKINVYGC